MADIPEIVEVTRVALNPGDVVVVHCDYRLNAEQYNILLGILEKTFPGHRALVLDLGARLSVAGPDAVAVSDKPLPFVG